MMEKKLKSIFKTNKICLKTKQEIIKPQVKIYTNGKKKTKM